MYFETDSDHIWISVTHLALIHTGLLLKLGTWSHLALNHTWHLVTLGTLWHLLLVHTATGSHLALSHTWHSVTWHLVHLALGHLALSHLALSPLGTRIFLWTLCICKLDYYDFLVVSDCYFQYFGSEHPPPPPTCWSNTWTQVTECQVDQVPSNRVPSVTEC